MSDPAHEIQRFAERLNARFRPLDEDDLQTRTVDAPPAPPSGAARLGVFAHRSPAFLAAAAVIVLALAVAAFAFSQRGDEQGLNTVGSPPVTTAAPVTSAPPRDTCDQTVDPACGGRVVPGTTEASTTTTSTPEPSTTLASPPPTRPATTSAPSSIVVVPEPTSTSTSSSTTTTVPPGVIFGRACKHSRDTVNSLSCNSEIQSASIFETTDPNRPNQLESKLSIAVAEDGTFTVSLPPGTYAFVRWTMGYRCYWSEPESNYHTIIQTLPLESGATINMDFFCTDSSGGPPPP